MTFFGNNWKDDMQDYMDEKPKKWKSDDDLHAIPDSPATGIDNLVREIQESIEWLETTEGDEVECIGIENLEGILARHFGKPIKLSKNN